MVVIEVIVIITAFVGICNFIANAMVRNDQRNRMLIEEKKIREIKFDLV